MNLKAYSGNGRYIFISYAHKDKEAVLPVIEQLQKNGYNVWFDEGIRIGAEWPEHIAEQVIGCTCFIGFISKNSVDSRECRNEIYLAEAENKDLFTILLEDTTLSPGLRMKLSTAQSIVKYNYASESDFYIKLLETEEIQKCKGSEEFQIFENKLIRYHGQLDHIVIPNDIRWIGFNAFEDCRGIRNIRITENVRRIGKYAFYGCTGLVAYSVDEDNDSYKDIEGVLYNKSESVVMGYPAAKAGSIYIVSDKTKRVQAFTFQNCNQLKKLILPETITHIDEQAFECCTELMEFKIPDSLRTITNKCFRGCTNLMKVAFGNSSVTKIESNAFSGCSNLLEINLPDRIECIETMAFAYCDSLQEIRIPSAMKEIADYTFYECTSLENIDFSGVTHIGNYAFKYCTSLEYLNFPASVKSIGFAAFSRDDSLRDVIIPDTVEKVSGYCFDFSESLERVVLGRGLELIAVGTFSGASNLRELHLSAFTKRICEKAFEGCDALADIYFEGTPEQWNAIDIEADNEALGRAKVHFEKYAQ